MTTLEWFKKHLSSMFKCKPAEYNRGIVSHPTFYSGVGVRDRIIKSKYRFDYNLWHTLIFNAELQDRCRNKMALSYVFYPCYASATTRDRLNMIARILDVPVRFSLKDDCLYADEMKCDFVLVYPGTGKIVYHVHGVDMDTEERNDYQVIKIYDKKGERWV